MTRRTNQKGELYTEMCGLYADRNGDPVGVRNRHVLLSDTKWCPTGLRHSLRTTLSV